MPRGEKKRNVLVSLNRQTIDHTKYTQIHRHITRIHRNVLWRQRPS